ncbi:MAG: hypothetical protein HY721_20100, partial [Planctomycetes bacterium]|nr:hypothetical protein [Planctomycetota bacterium]
MRWLGLLAALAIGPAATGQQRGGRALDAYQAELERLWVAIDFSDLEPEALAAQLGGDPAVLSRAVRERVRYEPYAGVLRGARGALLAGAGSSFDRAELLASLLRHGGRKVRMAWGRLTPAQAESLVRASLEVAPPARPGTPLREEVLSRAEDHFLLLGDALHAAGHRARPDPSAWAECVKDAAFHAWVQVEAGGVWIAVDPSAPEPVGRALAQPEGTAEAFDESLRHRGVLRLEVEKLVDGRSERQVVLEHAAPAADLAGVPLGFYHEIEPERAVPVLVAGDALVRGQAFPWAAPRGASAQAGALAGALGGEGEPSAPFVREWLSVTVVGPSGQRQALTPLSTEVGPGDRRAAAQAEEALETVHGVAVAVGGVPAALPLAILCGTANPLSEVGAVRLLAAKAFDYVAAREVLPASLVEPAPRSWVDRPNVIVA